MKKWYCKTCGGTIFEFESTRNGTVIFDDTGDLQELSEKDEFDFTVWCKECETQTHGYDDEEMQEIAELKEVTE